MSIKDTIEAIKGLPDDMVWVSQFPIADLRELVEGYERLRDAARDVLQLNDYTDAETGILARQTLREALRESYSRPVESPPARSGDGLGGKSITSIGDDGVKWEAVKDGDIATIYKDGAVVAVLKDL